MKKKLYDEYLQENKNKQKGNDIELNIYNNNNKNIFIFNNDDYFIEENPSQKIELTIKKEHILSTIFNNNKSKHIKIYLGSKKDCIKFSEILNENISENIGSYYHSTKKILNYFLI